MAYKYDEKKKDESPSAFSYQSQERKHCIGGTIGKSKKFPPKNESPGPGNYNLSSSFSGPKHKFSNSFNKI